jgi:hypothetical protein
MLGNDFVEDIVLRAGTFFRVKTYDLPSGYNDDCALFSS